MHIASMYSLSWRLPPTAYRPLCLLIIPIITHVAYRMVRKNMYSHMVPDDYQPDAQKMNLRQTQHRIYTVAAIAQFGTFAFLIRRNRFYWAPAAYTIAHFIWTDFTKRQEKIKGSFFESMDGPIRLTP